MRWRPWRALFEGRAGLYVAARGGLLLAMLSLAAGTASRGMVTPLVHLPVITLSVLALADIVLAHASIAFVAERRPVNLFRSAVLATLAFFEIPIAFAVLQLCCDPRSFYPPLTWGSALYFSVVTATTLGYGDIAPVPGARMARFLVIAELVVSVSFLAVLLARFISQSIGLVRPTGRHRPSRPVR